MASKHLRALVPRRPIVRILLLLVVAGAAIGIAGALFSGGETAARNPAIAETTPPPPGSAPVTSPTAATGTIDPPEAAVPAEPASPTNAAVDEPAASEAAAQLMERLQPLVAERNSSIPDYDRDYFAGWLDTDRDCVNTRHEILQAEAVGFSMNAEGCAVDSGEWFDPYTNRTFTDPRDLDVDHVVALADAWVSGAWEWADELLDRFSNDLGNLNAIAAGENRSKSAKGPAEYNPTAPAARCDYLVQYATVKIRWELSITPQDFDVLATGLTGCEVGIIPDASPTAPVAPPTAPDAPSAEAPPTTSTTHGLRSPISATTTSPWPAANSQRSCRCGTSTAGNFPNARWRSSTGASTGSGRSKPASSSGSTHSTRARPA